MKWENRDINVLEQANIPQFSRLDDIGTPLRLFEWFFANMLVDMIVGNAKLYGHREKADTWKFWKLKVMKISLETFCLFFGKLLLSGSHKLPDYKIY